MAVNKSHGSRRRTTWIIVIAVASSFLLCVVEWKFADTNPPREARRISSRSFVNQEIWLQQTSTRWRSASVTGLGQTCTSSVEFSSVLRLGSKIVGITHQKIGDYDYVLTAKLVADGSGSKSNQA